jgi:UDP-galactopyranose mutase
MTLTQPNTLPAFMNAIECTDVICFSHLRWNFVYQRPQHLMSRMATNKRVFFVEEPIFDDGMEYDVTRNAQGIYVIVPHLSRAMTETQIHDHQRQFLSRLLVNMNIRHYWVWYYTPMALPFVDHLTPAITVYDCMDELTAFKFAPPVLKELEAKLLKRSDIVFTGGHSLYDAKKGDHHNIHPFPSSIDHKHFSQARHITDEPADQENIPHPRFGFYGVIDERMNISLLAEVAAQRPEWHFVLLGPVVKISEQDLPRAGNIHYLGMKSYEELPKYLAGWDVAIMPFALNESTRYISPTKTPEFLAAGKPVISTPITDVVKQYSSVVKFADTAEDFIRLAENEIQYDDMWLCHVDTLLAENSWDKTWLRMEELIETTLQKNQNELTLINKQAYV